MEIKTKLPFRLYGSLVWSVGDPTTKEIFYKSTTLINAVTGSCRGDNSNMMNTPSYTDGVKFAVSYGLCNSSNTFRTALPRHDQVYVYVTPPQQDWMGKLVRDNPMIGAAPFACFALPGAHNAGSFDLSPMYYLCQGAGFSSLLTSLANYFPLVGSILSLTSSQAIRVIAGISVAQKDNIYTMLDMGCRYFDFRPGYAPTHFQGFLKDIYHLHSIIPGYKYSKFLIDILSWLACHPTEIVVIGLSSAGFPDELLPTKEKFDEIYAEVYSTVKDIIPSLDILYGDITHTRLSYHTLIESKTRLIFVNSSAIGWNTASVYDSYYEPAYSTTNPENILRRIQEMTIEKQVVKDYTVFQLQGTATNQNTPAIVASLITCLNDAYSPLLSTKAYFDYILYPKLPQLVGNLRPDHMLVLLNDFVDNKLASIASALTKQRVSMLQESM